MKKNNLKIPFVNLTKQYQDNKKSIDNALLSVLKKGQFILGEQVRLFEKEFASYLGVRFAVGVASGTDALILSLKALGIKEGDEVVMPANSYPTAFAVAAVKATIRLVDVDGQNFNIDVGKIEKAITRKTRAIIPVHLYGKAADLAPILKLGQKHNLVVVEDAAQAHGALYHGERVGTIGDIGCFSFYPTKNLGAYGDGGMVATNNEKVTKIIRELRVYGEKQRYQSVRLGVNSRLDELQAAILRVKLKRLDYDNAKRIKIARQYCQLLKGISLVLPQLSDDRSFNGHMFVVRTTKRDALASFLQKNGVATEIRYPTPVHLVKSFKYLGYKQWDFPAAEEASQELLALPCYPELTDSEVRMICSLVKRFFER